MESIRVVLVDDHRIVRRGLRSFLEAFPDITVIGESSSGEQVLEQIEGWLPDVVIMDLLMPGGMDGIETTRQVRAITPHTQIVVLTAHTDEARVVAALRAGAIGYLRKDAEPEMLLAAVRAAARGQSMLDPAVAGTVLHDLVSSTETRSISEWLTREVEQLLGRPPPLATVHRRLCPGMAAHRPYALKLRLLLASPSGRPDR
jgi:NarL family two-component system response regulator LiaR